jgi:choline dehydrogenase-like flavoprotein
MALVTRGYHVTILDVGNRLDSERQSVVDRMSNQEPTAWNTADLRVITGRGESGQEAIHSKKIFGSGFSFDSRNGAVGVTWKKSTGFNHSLAQGGLSNVWGSSLLPYCQEDMVSWPVTLAELEPHYRAVMNFVPCTNDCDRLEKLLPSYSSKGNQINLSQQGSSFWTDLIQSERFLLHKGILHGRARLAIKASGANAADNCRYCTLCLSGCPYGLIYSTAQTIEDLIRAGKVTYHREHLVENVTCSEEQAILSGRDLSTGKSFSLPAARVFIGAGVLPTAKIVLNSIGLFNQPIPLLDSQYFIYPLLRFKGTAEVEKEAMYTASQLFMEVSDPKISPHLIHLQVYGYSAFLHEELKKTFLRWPMRSTTFRKWFLGRLLVVQGFLHSKDSGLVSLTLVRGEENKSYLSAETHRSNNTFRTVAKLGLKLLQNAHLLKAIPLLPGLQFPKPGSGYHSGGTFPMSSNPRPLETDRLGRLPRWSRVHIVDSSIFPSIPATSITMSVMANSHRIASSACSLDEL